jgi:hypothetical protein
MSPESQSGSSRRRWRAPVVGALAGLAVAAAIVGQAALADSGGGSAPPPHAKPAGAPAPGGVPHQFTDAVAQLVQAGTINAAQGRAIDAQIETGSMNPQQMVSRGVVTAAQMAAVNDRLIAVKKSLASQAPPPGTGKDMAAPATLNCAAPGSAKGSPPASGSDSGSTSTTGSGGSSAGQ